MNVFCALVAAMLLSLLCSILPVRPAVFVTLDAAAHYPGPAPDPATASRTS